MRRLLTWLSKFMRSKILDFLVGILVVVLLITLAVVLRHGGRQSETKIPVNKSTATGYQIVKDCQIYSPSWPAVTSNPDFWKEAQFVASLMLSTVQKGFRPGMRDLLTK